MNILTLDHISKSYTGRQLFEDASFYLQEGEKVGIIGINGTGKSTLLRLIAGEEEADEGERIVASNLTVALLSQHPVFESGQTVLEAVMHSHVVSAREKGFDKQEAQVLQVEAKAKSMLTKLGLNDADFEKDASLLSGGQKKRLALVSVLLHQPDVLLLDEPTNHLDTAMSDWLEQELLSFRGTLVMITHDRYFLDSICNRIVEVDRGSLYSYDENYAGFLERKAEREEIAQAADRKRKSILRNELAWVMRGARARTTKQKARLERFEDLKVSKLLEPDQTIEIGSVSTRMGKTTVELNDLSKAYKDQVLLSYFTYIFRHYDRVGFIGPNGCGKSTLMKMIATAAADSVALDRESSVYPDSGTITIGQTIKLGYYSQEIATDKSAGIAYMDPNKKVLEFVKDTAEFVQTEDGPISASKMCERFLFDSEQQYSRIEKLSGGQKRRLHLLRILMEAPNVLILDEPTNDLDIRTLTILEDYLDHFDGIVIVVSHDRYFLDRIAKRLFVFEGNGVLRQSEGGYTDYLNRLPKSDADSSVAKTGKNQSVTGKLASATTSEVEGEKELSAKEQYKASKVRGKRMTYNEQREYETIEEDISKLEEKIENLEQEILKSARDFVQLAKLTKEKEELEETLSEKMDRWVYLEELAAEVGIRL